MSAVPRGESRSRPDLTVVPDQGRDLGSVEHPNLPNGGLAYPDDPNFRAFHTFAQFLTTRPSLDDVAQFLCGVLNWPTDANGCLLITAGAQPRELLARSVDPLHPWAALTDPTSVPPDVVAFLNAHHIGVSAYWDPPESSEQPHFGVWALGSPTDPLAYLVVAFRTHMNLDSAEMLVRPLSGLLAVYLAGMESGEHVHDHGAAHSHQGEMAHGRPTELNDRQRSILSLMAQGLTNPQIAARIGFSESTVRMESLSIYRFLDVHDRHDAVIAGQRLGLVPHLAQD